jgi:hypothetical protein
MVREFKNELEKAEAAIGRPKYQITLTAPKDVSAPIFKQHFPKERGVFVPITKVEHLGDYNPCEVWKDLLAAVDAVDERSPEKVLEFVNRLGIGVESDGLYPYDVVTVTQRCLADLKAALDNFANANKSRAAADAFSEFLNANLGLKPEDQNAQAKVTHLVTIEVRLEGKLFRRQLRIQAYGALLSSLYRQTLYRGGGRFIAARKVATNFSFRLGKVIATVVPYAAVA